MASGVKAGVMSLDWVPKAMARANARTDASQLTNREKMAILIHAGLPVLSVPNGGGETLQFQPVQFKRVKVGANVYWKVVPA